MTAPRMFCRTRLIALLFALVAAIAFTACASDGDSSSGNISDDDTGTDDVDDDGDDTFDDDSDDDADDDADDDTTLPLCAPPASGPRAALRVGLGVGSLYAPIGGSMGGYGDRPGPAHPYAVMMGGSTGYFGKPDVKALAFDNGEERLVIARIAAAGVSEYLYREVLGQVCAEAGVYLTGRLWLSATHDHSGPAHMMPVPVVLGGVGTDTFDRGYTRRIAKSIADAVIQSLDSLEPAALAATIVEPFDPNDTWSADRRCQNDPPRYKEDRLFMARVDRADGTPLAVLFSFPVHGVWMGKTLMSTDIPGAIEYGLQDTFDRPVEALFLQGPAGDVNPSGTPHHHEDEQGMEWHARSLAPVLREVYDDLHPTTDVALGMAARPLHISRAEIGYRDDEFGAVSPFTGAFEPYADGAFYCGSPDVWSTLSYFADHGSTIDCGDPATRLIDGYYGCVLPILFIDAWWTWALNPTEIADVRLGDDLLSLIPGELTSWLSKKLREDLHTATGVAEDHIATFGYSNGFQSYLLTEWDWLQGGYETSINTWGPRFGDWLVRENVALARDLWTGAAMTVPEPVPPDIPWPDLIPENFEEADSPGVVTAPVESSYRRFETVAFSWAGGFTGADFPRVTFEKDGDAGFEPVVLPSERVMTDGDMRTVLSYEANPGYDARRFPSVRRHEYTISWELTADVPLGRYRLRVEGHTWNGASIVPYALESDPFTIAESDQVRVQNLAVQSLGGDDFSLTCDGQWPPNPSGYRLRHPDYGPDEWSPVAGGTASVTIDVDGGLTEVVELTGDGEGRFTGTWHRTQTGLAHSARVAAGDLHDGFGNTNAAGTEPVAIP